MRAAITRHELTPTSGIREIRSIRNATRRRSAKPRTTTGLPSLEFVIESDETLQWNAVEQFKMELAELVSKYGLRFGESGGLKNEAAVKEFIKRHRAKRDSTSRALSAANLDALRAEADKLNAQYTDRAQRRVEQAVRRLIDQKWKAKVGAALRSRRAGRSRTKRRDGAMRSNGWASIVTK